MGLLLFVGVSLLLLAGEESVQRERERGTEIQFWGLCKVVSENLGR